MQKDYEKLFTRLKPLEPPEDLLNKILNNIQKEKRLLAIKKRIAIFSLGFLASAIGFIPASQAVYVNITESGFFDIFSLIFSDFGAIADFGSQYILSLLELLPAASIALLLTIMFALFGSLKYLAQDLTRYFAMSLTKET